MAVTKQSKIYLNCDLTDIVKVDTKFDETTGKITYIIHNVDGTTTVKTSDKVAITNLAITVAFDV